MNPSWMAVVATPRRRPTTRVRQLVRDDGGEERQGDEEPADQPVERPRPAPARRHGRLLAADERDQGDEERPGERDPDLDAEDPGDRDPAVHRATAGRAPSDAATPGAGRERRTRAAGRPRPSAATAR